MNYPDLLRTLPMTTILPPPGWLFDEIEPSMHLTSWGLDYDDERLIYDDTTCSVCGGAIGPMDGGDGDYGQPTSTWRLVFAWGAALFCEECAEEIDPVPSWIFSSFANKEAP